jgi:predicted esterase
VRRAAPGVLAVAAALGGCRSGAAERGAALEATASRASADAEAAEGRPPEEARSDAQIARIGLEAGGLAPLPDDPLFTNLGPGEGGTDVVAIPNGAISPRPVLVVLHGSGDRPDWNCDAWRHITGARGFVLCPRGEYVAADSTPGDKRYTIRGGAALRAHLDEAFGMLGERFAGYVDETRPLAAGFSLGATEIAQVAILHPERFSRVALLEGGHAVWTASAIRSFVDDGGRRVLFGCGSTWCLGPAQDAAKRLHAGGVEARVVQAPVGHTNDRPLQEAIMTELAWFLDGDARWAAQP